MPGIQIGPISITYYGIILMLGAVAAAFLAEREARRKGLPADFVWDALIWILIGGIVGARLWHIFTPPPSMVEQGITTAYYLTHPLDLINTRAGGVGIPGAIIGGGLALYFFTRRKKMNFGTWADIAAPALALGQAVGRWGNFVNQELYGAPTNLPWAITIDPAHRFPEYATIARYHPLFLYESLWNLANMAILLLLARDSAVQLGEPRIPFLRGLVRGFNLFLKKIAEVGKQLKPGDIFLVYLLIYPLGRFWMEFLRLDSAQIAGINANQTLALVVALVAGFFLYWRHRPSPAIRVSAADEVDSLSETSDRVQ